MGKYRAKVHVIHDDKSYAPGDVFSMEPKAAESLVKIGALEPSSEPSEEPGPAAPPITGLEGVDFASDEAAEAASAAGLAATDFDGLKPSGQGGFTKADVSKAAATKQGQ